MMKKKGTSIVVVGMMLLALAACGSEGRKTIPTATPTPKLIFMEAATPTPIVWLEQDKKPEVPAITATPKPTEKITVTPKPTEPPTATPKPKATATPKPTTTPVPEKLSYEKGVLTEYGFESKWMGVRFSAPKGAELSTQAELDETMRVLDEALYGGQAGEQLDYTKLAVVYELEAVWPSDDLLMQVIVECLPEGSMSVEEYATQTKEELTQFAGDGIAYIIDDKLYPVNIGGQEFYNFGIITEYGSEVEVHQDTYLKVQDGRLIMISFTSDKEADEQIQKILKSFSAY